MFKNKSRVINEASIPATSVLRIMVASTPRPGAKLFFVFIILLISHYAMPYCVKDCNRKFANDAALSRHRKACPVLKIVRQRSQDIRRDKGTRGSLQDATTLLTCKQRLQVILNCSAFKVFYLQFSGTFKWERPRRNQCGFCFWHYGR